MENVTISNKALQVINLLKGKRVGFLSISNYENKQGEISNYLINLGASYENAKQKDIEYLKNLNPTSLEKEFKSEYTTLETARVSLLESFINPNENRSNGQINAFTHICTGLKVHNETGLLYIFGLKVSKTVIQKGIYKEVKSSALTIAKNELRKQLKTGQFVQFSLEIGNTIKISNETLEL